jgi:hypothetical protein
VTTQEVDVIDPKINIRSKPAHSLQSEPSIKDSAAIALAGSAVQTRAYELYERGGRVDGRAEQDWYQAETDLRARSKQT